MSSGPADMESQSYVDRREELKRTLKATNMHLESELSELRASLPRTKHASNAEKIVYLSHLQKLMKSHLKQGGKDSRGAPSRSELAQADVPLERVERDQRVCYLRQAVEADV